MLIQVGAPESPAGEGMVANPDSPLAPGAPPPLVMPMCAKCRLPVERFTLDPVSSPYYLGIQFECCGRTGGMRLPHDEVLFKRRHGGVVVVNQG